MGEGLEGDDLEEETEEETEEEADEEGGEEEEAEGDEAEEAEGDDSGRRRRRGGEQPRDQREPFRRSSQPADRRGIPLSPACVKKRRRGVRRKNAAPPWSVNLPK